ncbi:MAG: hypothetical protein WBP58_18335 [Chitinophagaceae bacterium]
MSDKSQHIMHSSSGHVDEQKLMDYLEGKLSKEQVYEVEQMMTESGFLNDAMEGLSEMKDKQRIATILHELNSKLQVKTQKQKRKYQPLFPNQQTLTLVVLITILLLVTLGFVIFKMSQTQ